MNAKRDDSGVNNDPRIDASERSLYRLVAYVIVFSIVGFQLGKQVLPEFVAGGAAAFLVALGSWFVDDSKRSRISLLNWAALCVVTAAFVAGLLYTLDRLWPVG